jgi:hypothetical protein
MSFFKRFPTVGYDFNGNNFIVSNITKRTIVSDEVYTTPNVLSNYKIKSNETPRSIAYELYDDAELFWVVLIVNNIFDLYLEWPKVEDEFEEFLSIKYNSEIESIHHYEDFKGMVILNGSLPAEETIAVTNRTYEIRINEAKSNIKLLEPEFINDFVENYHSEISK